MNDNAKCVTTGKGRLMLGAIVVVGLIVFLVLQYRTSERLRAEKAALKEAAAIAERDRAQAKGQFVTEQEAQRARSEHSELLRLRGEHAQLVRLRSENDRLRGLLAARPMAEKEPEAVEEPAVAQRIACLNNSRQLVLSAIMYAEDHQGKFPESTRWCEALQPYFGNTNILSCPSEPGGQFAYGYNAALSGLFETNLTNPSDTVVFVEADAGWNGVAGLEQAKGRHEDKVVLGFADGSCRVVRKELLKDLIWDPMAKKE